MFYQLPPVGNQVVLSDTGQHGSSLDSIFSPYQSRFFSSGTAALAAAVRVAVSLKKISEPEVILPAYGCPDLMSAVLYAGVKPVLVDLEQDRPWMNLEQLSEMINEHTVAVIAADLFGISERIDLIHKITKNSGIVLIEDSAQAFPVSSEDGFWGGDLVVLSFGRGKPVSVLGGGATLYRDSRLGELFPSTPQPDETGGMMKKILFGIKARIYNRMLSPRLYWLPQSLPFLHLGETRFHPLDAIAGMSVPNRLVLPANIGAYQQSATWVQDSLEAGLEKINAVTASIVDLKKACGVSGKRRLLRYPLLVDASTRDNLYRRLARSGLGPSRMYPASMPAIEGLEAVLKGYGPYQAAESFAQRILTLPVHDRVSKTDIRNILEVLSSVR